MKTEKIILTSKTALTIKYGNGFKAIEAALKTMIVADKARGIHSKLIYLDQASSMSDYKAPVVKTINSAQQVKRSIDALFKMIKPNYILLVGSLDVIPHVELQNLIKDDDDDLIPSDLPYACSAPYSTKIADFLAPTRVLGRLPDITGGTDEKYLVGLIENAIRTKPLPAEHYKKCFSLTAKVWNGSTSESLIKITGNKTGLKNVPTAGPTYTASELNAPLHFINCHGSSLEPFFYGQQRSNYPIALSSENLKKHISDGTIVAAECCYGAELFDPEYSDGALAICNAYLGEGAAAYVGSTTVAYGPADGQGLADLITQYFLINVLKGASTGRAFLDAQLRFMDKSAPHIDPQELKTIAQFLLLGDPSVQPVILKVPSQITKSKSDVARLADRDDRRAKLMAWGESLEKFCKKPELDGISTTGKEVLAVLKFHHFSTRKKGTSYRFGEKPKGKGKNSPGMSCTIYIDTEKSDDKIRKSRMLIIREMGGQVIDSRIFERK
jgi:Peptidase family C25